jgi:mRNA-degrading endonuclease toxin of MazEF toxin-antitoxin module
MAGEDTPRLTSLSSRCRSDRPIPSVGNVNTDNIEALGKNELGDYLGTLAPASILAVNRALAVALGLP